MRKRSSTQVVINQTDLEAGFYLFLEVEHAPCKR